MKQKELDKAEKYILDKLFGDISKPTISKKLQMVLVAKNIDFDDFINKKIQIFEEFSKDIMTNEGLYDGAKVSKLLVVQFPLLEGLNVPDIKPLDLAIMIDNIIGLDTVGQWIQTF
jgi:hypothetical protein